MNNEVQTYIFEEKHQNFRQLLIVLYDVILGLNQEIEVSIKWQLLAFDFKGAFLGLGAFKHKVSLFFFRGAEITDTHNLFAEQKGKALRTLNFICIEEIDEVLENYLLSAIAVNKGPKSVKKRAPSKPMPTMPVELKMILQKHPAAASFFNSLNNSQKREYINWITSAKRPETKVSRLAKTELKLLAEETCWSKYKK